MNNKMLLQSLTVLLAFCTVIGSANAAIVTYDNKINFQNATAATSATGTLPDSGNVGSSTTINGVTFSLGTSTSTRLFVGASGVASVPGGDWTPLIGGNDIALSGTEDLDVDFTGAVFSAGFDFVEPNVGSGGEGCNTTCFDTTFDVALKLGASLIDSFSFNATDDVLSFIGVWSDSAFDRLEIRDSTGTTDNEYFGEFYTGTRSLSEVPVPAAAWLFGTALIGLVGFSKRRQAA